MDKRDSIAQQTFPMPPSPSADQLLDNGQGVIDPDVYFEMNKPPANLPDFEDKLNAFVDYHKDKGTRMVLITASACYFVLRAFI